MKKGLQKVSNIIHYRNKPVSLIHFLTNRCNARCPHCFIDFGNASTQKAGMSLSDIDKLTKSVGPQLMNVNFTGGEPFLASEITEVSDAYIRNTSIDSIFFSTHGGFAERVKDYTDKFVVKHPSTKFIFSISIDHLYEKHSDYRKVKNLFEQAIDTYMYLKNRADNILTNITITVSPYNADSIEEIFEELVNKHNVEAVTANIVRTEGVYTTPLSERERILNAYSKLVQLIKDNMQSGRLKGMSTKTVLGRMMNFKELRMYEYIQQTYLRPQFQLPCYAGGGLLGVIYPNGDVYPCEILNDKKMGNLYDYDMNITKLWEANAALRKWVLESKCNCSYECAWSYNILSSPKHWPEFALSVIR